MCVVVPNFSSGCFVCLMGLNHKMTLIKILRRCAFLQEMVFKIKCTSL